jgi:hypothetical protein
MVRIHLPGREEQERHGEPVRIEDLLRELGINPVEVVIAKNGELVTEGEYAGEKDVVRIYRISHGG